MIHQFEKAFIVLVVVLDLVAIVYFGGRLLSTGTVFAAEPNHVVVMEPAKEAATAVAKVEKPAFDPSTFVADAMKGERLSSKCKACHSFTPTGKNKVGPALWGIYGAEIAANTAFNYSSAFNDKKGEIVWTTAELDAFMERPRSYIKGTKMAFAGIRKPEDRLHLIEWMKTLK